MQRSKDNSSQSRQSSSSPRANVDDDDANAKEQPDLQLGRHHCTTKDLQDHLHHGHLCVTSRGVFFETAIRSKTLWTLKWDDVSAISKARTDEGLCFEVGNDTKYSVNSLEDRNVLFTQIIGYTGLSWQVSN